MGQQSSTCTAHRDQRRAGQLQTRPRVRPNVRLYIDDSCRRRARCTTLPCLGIRGIYLSTTTRTGRGTRVSFNNFILGDFCKIQGMQQGWGGNFFLPCSSSSTSSPGRRSWRRSSRHPACRRVGDALARGARSGALPRAVPRRECPGRRARARRRRRCRKASRSASGRVPRRSTPSGACRELGVAVQAECESKL
jgi:hypothetical protein